MQFLHFHTKLASPRLPLISLFSYDTKREYKSSMTNTPSSTPETYETVDADIVVVSLSARGALNLEHIPEWVALGVIRSQVGYATNS